MEATRTRDMSHKPFLREAAVTVIPRLGDDQLRCISDELELLGNPYLLVCRLSANTLLIQGIPVRAGSTHDADALTWETIYAHVHGALKRLGDRKTTVIGIDVREPSGALL